MWNKEKTRCKFNWINPEQERSTRWNKRIIVDTQNQKKRGKPSSQKIDSVLKQVKVNQSKSDTNKQNHILYYI